MEKLRNKFRSVRVRLFFSLCVVVIAIVLFLIILNNVILETFYLYSKTKNVMQEYDRINYLYNQIELGVQIDIEAELNKIATKNEFDIVVENQQFFTLYTTDSNFSSLLEKLDTYTNNRNFNNNHIIYSKDNVKIAEVEDELQGVNYILLNATLDNGYQLYIRIQTESIRESVQVSNNLLILIGMVSVAIAGILASYISKKFTEPILELNEIAKSMAKLDFRKKYQIKDTNDEINDLGKSINSMSQKLETTIQQLRNNNIELEKDIEEKSKIDEMRKQFISDVSHELKTPIALIQGYAEGLLENVNEDEESRNFYAQVILDESNKMDKLVKQLLELMKLEYGKRELNNETFDIIELIKEVIRKCNVMLKEKNIEIELEPLEPVYVVADDFYIEQVVTNYITNAIKHAKEKQGKKLIRIQVETKQDKVRVTVFNTGEKIAEEDLERIWKRFYKVDTSRNRDDGGTGIGLALVKAIMNNYGNDFGVRNHEEGVEFYFELDAQK